MTPLAPLVAEAAWEAVSAARQTRAARVAALGIVVGGALAAVALAVVARREYRAVRAEVEKLLGQFGGGP